MEQIRDRENITQASLQTGEHWLMKVKRQFKAFIKRTIDILSSVLGLILLAPFFGMIAVAIKRDSEGPIYYRAERIGRHGKIFKMLKFRTMYDKFSHEITSPLTSNNDPRVTPVGHWLRDTKLNELPQLWNVLKGDMSLVGPRPESSEFVEKWPESYRKKILSMRPGVTSPASIIYRDEEQRLNGINFLDDYLKEIMPDKLRLDLLYVDTHSFATDLDVIFMTLIAILPQIHKIRFKEATIFSGPIYGIVNQHLTWFIIDFVVTMMAVGIAGLAWRATEVINLGITRATVLALIISVIFGIISTVIGLRRVVWRYASSSLVIDVALSVFITAAIAVLANYLLYPQFTLPFDFVLNFSLIMFIGLISVRYQDRLITGVANRWINFRSGTKSLGEPVLIVGAGAGGELAVWLLNKSEYAPAFSITGFVDDDYRKQKTQMAGFPVLGTTKDIPALVKEHHIGLILFSISNIKQSERQRILSLCDKTDARVIVIPDLLQILNESEPNGSIQEGK